MHIYLKSNDGNNSDLRKVCSVYIGVTICLIGLIGNFFSIVVWIRINKKRSDSGKSAGVYLIILAVIDCGLLVMFLCTESIQVLKPGIVHNLNYVRFYSYFGFPMYYYFICASIWMVVCVTVNRFFAVVFPFFSRKLNNLKMTYTISSTTLLVSFVVNAPHFFNYHPFVNHQNKHFELKETKYGQTDGARKYDFWVHCMFLVLIPWITIFCLNSVIIYKLCTNQSPLLNKSKPCNSREKQTTIVLLTISISFLVLLLWQCVTQCFWMLSYKKDNPNVWNSVDSAYDFARLGVVINSSLNFVLYCISGTMFRKEICKMFNLHQESYSSLNKSEFSKSESTLPISINDDASNENICHYDKSFLAV